MLIDKLNIKGFKNISNISINNFYTTKCIIGINGVGKSNLLSLIAFVSSAFSGVANNYLDFYSKTSLDVLPFGNLGSIIDVTLGFTGHNNINCSVKIKHLADNNFNVQINNQSSKGLDAATDNTLVANYLSNIAYYNSYYNNLFWFSNINNYVCNKNNQASNMFAILRVLKHSYSNIYLEITNLIKFFNPLIKQILLQEDTQKVLVELAYCNKMVDLFSISDGSLRFFILLTLLKLPANLRPNLLMLEEPEVGLNPFLVDILGDLINSYSQSSKVIFTTHSNILLNKLQPQDIKVLDIDNKTGSLSLNNLDATKLEPWLQSYSLGDLWLMNLIGASVFSKN